MPHPDCNALRNPQSDCSLGLLPRVYLQCSESLDHLVAVGAVYTEQAVEVLAIEAHNGHHDVGRCASSGTSPTDYVDSVTCATASRSSTLTEAARARSVPAPCTWRDLSLMPSACQWGIAPRSRSLPVPRQHLADAVSAPADLLRWYALVRCVNEARELHLRREAHR
jgi:hypothetical protein